MKYIFDFDDVLFDAQSFKQERLFPSLEIISVSKEECAQKYHKGGFKNLHLFLNQVATEYGKTFNNETFKIIEEKVFKNIHVFLNVDVYRFVEQKGKENCCILSLGDYDFQMRKIVDSGAHYMVANVVVVPKSKKEWVIDYAQTHSDEQVYFIDDTRRHIEHTEFSSVPNLKTILYIDKNSLLIFD